MDREGLVILEEDTTGLLEWEANETDPSTDHPLEEVLAREMSSNGYDSRW